MKIKNKQINFIVNRYKDKGIKSLNKNQLSILFNYLNNKDKGQLVVKEFTTKDLMYIVENKRHNDFILDINKQIDNSIKFYKEFNKNIENNKRIFLNKKIEYHKIDISTILIKMNKDNTKVFNNYCINENTIYMSLNKELFDLNKFKIDKYQFTTINIKFFDYQKIFVLFDKENINLIKELIDFNYRYFNLKNYLFDNSIKPYYIDLNNENYNVKKIDKLTKAYNDLKVKKVNKTTFIDNSYKINENKVNKEYKPYKVNNLKLNDIKVFNSKLSIKCQSKDINTNFKLEYNNIYDNIIKTLQSQLKVFENKIKVVSQYKDNNNNNVDIIDIEYSLKQINRFKVENRLKKGIKDNNLNIILLSNIKRFTIKSIMNKYNNEYIDNLLNKIVNTKNLILFFDNQRSILLNKDYKVYSKENIVTIDLNKIIKDFDKDFNSVIFENNKDIKNNYLSLLNYYKSQLIDLKYLKDLNKCIDYIKNKENKELTTINDFLIENINEKTKVNKHNSINDKERPIINNWSYDGKKLRLIN